STEGDTAGSGHDVSANHGEGSTPTDSGEGESLDDAPVVELETSGALPEDVEPAEVAAWSPDIWLGEGADNAQAEQAAHAPGDGAIGGMNAEPGGSPEVKPATTGITVERTNEVGIERRGQWYNAISTRRSWGNSSPAWMRQRRPSSAKCPNTGIPWRSSWNAKPRRGRTERALTGASKPALRVAGKPRIGRLVPRVSIAKSLRVTGRGPVIPARDWQSATSSGPAGACPRTSSTREA